MVPTVLAREAPQLVPPATGAQETRLPLAQRQLTLRRSQPQIPRPAYLVKEDSPARPRLSRLLATAVSTAQEVERLKGPTKLVNREVCAPLESSARLT